MSWCVVASTAFAAGALEGFLGMDPVKAAERAFSSGDRRYLVVPMCGQAGAEVLPGWPLKTTGDHVAAISAGKRPVTCADMGSNFDEATFARVAQHAEKYNRRMLQLEGRPEKQP